MLGTIKLDVVNGNVAVSIVDRLDKVTFNKYINCIRGFGKFNADKRYHECNGSEITKVISLLKEVGFKVIGSPEVRNIISASENESAQSIVKAIARSEIVNEILASRGMSLYPYQKDGVSWLASRKNAILSDEMGLGKTVQALVAANTNKIIVVCPAIAKGVWRREANRFRPDMKAVVLNGRNGFRMPEENEIVIVNYDILPPFGLTKEMIPVYVGDVPENITLIADECHAIKNYDAKRTKKFRALTQAIREKSGNVWLLTATPMLNRPSELWSILQSANLATEAFTSWHNFKYLFNGRSTSFGVEWGNPRPEVPEMLKRVCLRRRRIEVLPDLPEKTYNSIEVDLDLVKNQEAIEVADEIENAIVNNGISDEDLLKGNGIEFETIARARRLLASAKIDAMLEMIGEYEESDQPVVVFSAHRDPVEAFKNRAGWAIITGDTTPENRTKIENDFQAGKLKGVACTIKAGGVSITLTNAHIAIFTDLEWTPALNLQAEDRICRIGQTRGVIINKLIVNHPLDNRIAAILARKQDLISKTGL